MTRRRFYPSNRENMRTWVAALRSGVFQQGKNVLRAAEFAHDAEGKTTGVKGYKFCCLGVAAEVASISGLDLRSKLLPISHDTAVTFKSAYFQEGDEGVAENSHLPRRVKEWLGLENNNPVVFETAEPLCHIEATNANDGKEWDFNRIADELEYTYMLQFTDEQIIAAGLTEVTSGNVPRGNRILAMVSDTTGVELPAPPNYEAVSLDKTDGATDD